MRANFFNILFSTLLVGIVSFCAQAQSVETGTIFDKDKPKEDQPRRVKEMLAKMRIEQEKKEHDEMLERGEEALRLSEQLEKSFAGSNQLSQQDQKKLDDLEKIVKKIRSGLGGDDDDGEENPDNEKVKKPSTLLDGFKVLQSTTLKLVDELKKTTRFSISAIAIQSSNTVLKIVRFLRLRK